MTQNQKLPLEVQEKVDLAKSEGHAVYSLSLSGIKYIYRSINREEFRKLQSQIADESEQVRLQAIAEKKGLSESDPKLAEIDAQIEKKAIDLREAAEERLVKTGLLHPQLTPNTPAGVHTTIADRIMQASAFGDETEPEML